MMKKVQAEPDSTLPAAQQIMRWIINGLTVLNNKGKPVKQYEPAFSDAFGCELPQANGVTPIMYYDAAGRLVRTELPDGTFSRVEFSPWQVKSFDANDTVNEPGNAWYAERTAPTASLEDQRAAKLALVHQNTPALVVLDSLGREVIAIAHNRIEDANSLQVIDGKNYRDERYLTFTKLDAEGKPLWIRDARGNLVMQYLWPAKPDRDEPRVLRDFSPLGNPNNDIGLRTPCYDIAGNLLFQHSMDAGNRWMLMNAAGKPMFAWDFNEREEPSAAPVGEQRLYCTDYDALHRPTRQWLSITGGARRQIERYQYRDTRNAGGTRNARLAADQAANLIGQLVQHYDPSGRIETVRRDFKGNVLKVERRLNNRPTESLIDWESNPAAKLSAETFTQITEYDALNRMTRLFNWHLGEGSRVAVYKPTYGERGQLFSEDLITRAKKVIRADGRDDYDEVADTPPPNPMQGTRTTTAIQAIRYNVKGQKTFLQLGNGTITRYTYDEKTFRLTHLYTKRTPSGPGHRRFDDDCTSNTADAPRPQRSCGVQNLHYTYDPVGNIAHIHDDAQQTIFFDGAMVEPSNDYEYDALYRLISANGRETAQSGDAERDGQEPDYINGFPVTNHTLRNYVETYEYDSVGNFVQFTHAIERDTTNSWTRHHQYAFDDPARQPASNRLWRTWNGADDWTNNRANSKVEYKHDPHGNMLNLANVPDEYHLHWDHRDMIRHINLGGGGQAYYQYDAGKQRTRKYIDRNDRGIEERIYLGGYELYRRRVGGAVVEEIESHHLFEGEQRVLLINDVIITSKGTPNPRPDGLTVKAQTLFRYQYSNHLGSAGLELDDKAEIISYEEYHPYGTSAYRAMKTGIEAPPKRYRYTGMERDEESGLSYHAARYYLPWMGRWLSCDPLGVRASLNVLTYGKSNPIMYLDTTGRADYAWWPKGTSFISPENTGSVGTKAHQDILPVVADRINREGFFSADTEVKTLPGGSKQKGSWKRGEIDLRVHGSTQGNKIADLKSLGGKENALKQTKKYALFDDTQFSSKSNDRPLTEYAENALETVESGNRTYLLSQDKSTPEKFFWYRYDKVAKGQTPQVEFKPTVSVQKTIPGASTAPTLAVEPATPINLKSANASPTTVAPRLSPRGALPTSTFGNDLAGMAAKLITQPFSQYIADRYAIAAGNSFAREFGGEETNDPGSSMQRDAAHALIGQVPPGTDVAVTALAGGIAYVFTEVIFKPVMVEYYRQYPTPMDFFNKVYQ